MKYIKSFDLKFLGYGLHLSKCKIHIFQDESDIFHGVMEDISEGTSVTNAAEIICSEVRKRELLDHHTTSWYEIYPYYDSKIVEVKMEFDMMSEEYRNPRWQASNDSKLLSLVHQTIQHEKR